MAPVAKRSRQVVALSPWRGPAAERDRERPGSSDDPAAVRDQAGAGPESAAGYPGAPGAQETVFGRVGLARVPRPALTGDFPDA
jgi:hypothetical protein